MILQIENLAETSPFEDRVAGMLAQHEFFQPQVPVWVARAPGRLDLMGGNVDYTGGLVLQSLLSEAVWVAVQPRSDDVVQILNPGAAKFGWETALSLAITDLSDIDGLCLVYGSSESSCWG